jgi:ribonuclease D
MKPDSILEELWAVKDKLAREAGYDVNRFVQNLRLWEEAHPQTGRVIRNAEELRQFVTEEERKRATASELTLRESPPHQD